MSYCLNPYCLTPTNNPSRTQFCQNCGSPLLLKDRYRVLKLIGQGGFGRTFLAVDEHKPSKPYCVVKQFFPKALGLHHAKKAADLFEQEAVRLDDLGKHPQIPELLAHFGQDGRQYLVQEFIEGQNLAQALAVEGVFREIQIENLLNSLLPVLEFIHTHNIIHRDIKPENIIRRPDGQLVLVDFGAAKYATGTALLKTGTTIGTPEYVAPEQARGKAVFASDLYGLGVTCIHLFTQVSPFHLFDTSENIWVWRHYLVGISVSDEFGRILDRLIEPATKRRYQSASEVLTALNPRWTPTVAKSVYRPTSQTWTCVETLTAHSNSVCSVAISPDGRMLASGSCDKTIKLWNLETGQLRYTLNGHSRPVLAVAFRSTSQFLASGSVDNTIKLWNLRTGSVSCTIAGDLESVVSLSLAFSSDGDALACGSDDRTVKIWQLSTGKLLNTLKHPRGVNAVVFSPDGQTLASGSSENNIRLWHLATSELISVLEGHSRDVNTVAISPDGEIIASGSSDNTIKLWHLASGEILRTLEGHSDWVRSVVFSPDRQLLISGSADCTIKIWQLNSGEVLHTLSEHKRDVNAVAISPDGQTLVSGSSDKTIKIWRMS